MMKAPVWVTRLEAHHIPEPRLLLDPGWRELDILKSSPAPVVGSREWRSRDGLLVLATVDVFSDDSTWLHVSCSRTKHIPTYADLARVKRVFVGPKREALQKFAAEDEHVNIHDRTLHLWSRLDGPSSPDFRLFEPNLNAMGV